MLLDIILISITFLVLLIASYTDLKTREVPDWLNYSLIVAALGIRAIFATEFGWNMLLSGLLGFAACFLLAHFFYYTNQWGGGDSKLFMGMGAIIGITYPLDKTSFTLLFFLVALLFLGALYGIIWMLILAIKKRTQFLPKFKARIKKFSKLHASMILLTFLFLALTFAHSYFWPLILFPLLAFYLFLFVNVIEEHCFIKRIPPHKLTEGDWLAEHIAIAGQTIILKKTIEKNDLKKLQELERQGKLPQVSIKEGIPFVPSFFFAYVLITITHPDLSSLALFFQ